MKTQSGMILPLAAAAFLSASLQLQFLPGVVLFLPGVGMMHEPVAIARTLADRGAFADPYPGLPTGPTAHMPPLFPLFLYMLIRFFGETPAFGTAALFLCLLMHAVYAGLFVPVSRLFFRSEAPGTAAALLAILLPSFPVLPQWEAIYVAVGSMVFCLLSANCLSRRLSFGTKTLAVGGMAGVLLLLSSTALMVVVPCLLYLVFGERWPLGRAVVFLLAVGFVTMLVLTPWAVRNYYALGSPIFLRGNLGLEIALSNNDSAESSQVENLRNGTSESLHPHLSRNQALQVKALGEVEYNRRKMREGIFWIRDHPRRFTVLTLQRARDFWFPNPDESVCAYSLWIVTLASAGGLVLLTRSRAPSGLFFVSVLALFPIVYYFLHSSIRYRAPIAWVTVLLAGYFLTAAWTGTTAARIRGWLLARLGM